MNKALSRIVNRHITGQDYEAVINLKFGGTTSQTFDELKEAVLWAQAQDGDTYEVMRGVYGNDGVPFGKTVVARGLCRG